MHHPMPARRSAMFGLAGGLVIAGVTVGFTLLTGAIDPTWLIAPAAAAIAGKSVRVLLCDTTSGDPDDQGLLQAAAAAAIPVVQLGATIEPAGASFASWLTGQLDEIHQALAGT